MVRIQFSLITRIKIFAVFLSLGLLGCASLEKNKTLSAKELYKQGVEAFNKKNFKRAEEIFNNIVNDFPNNKIRAIALIALASSKYEKGDYEEAKFHFKSFIEQFPVHPQVAKAYYYKAMCSFNQMESYERDQSNTHYAIQGFEKVIKTFPEGKYTKLAKRQKKICRTKLAMNLLYIGRFYFRLEAYQSVINRMTELLENYPKQKFLDEAIFLLGESYLREDNKGKAYFTFKNLIKKYPRSKFKVEARSKLVLLKQL